MGFASAMAWLLFAISMMITGINIFVRSRFVFYQGERRADGDVGGRRTRRRSSQRASTNPMPQVVAPPPADRSPTRGWVSQGLFVLLLTGLSILFLYPFLWLISASFKPRGESFDNALIPHHWAWNFTGPNLPEPHPQYLFNVAPVGRWIFNSIWISFLGAACVTFSSALVAFAFAYFRFPLRNFLFGDPARDDDAAGRGDDDPRLPALEPHRQVHARASLAAASARARSTRCGCRTCSEAPSTSSCMRQFFLGIPRDYFEAARMDGDGYFSMFRRIALPLAKPALIVDVHLRDAGEVVRPDDAAHLSARHDALHRAARPEDACSTASTPAEAARATTRSIMAGTLLLVIPMVLLFAGFQKYFIRGIAVQGRKG